MTKDSTCNGKEKTLYNMSGGVTSRSGYVLCSHCKEGKFIFEDADSMCLHLVTCPVCRELFSITFDAGTNCPVLCRQGAGYEKKPSEKELAEAALETALRLPPRAQECEYVDYCVKCDLNKLIGIVEQRNLRDRDMLSSLLDCLSTIMDTVRSRKPFMDADEKIEVLRKFL